MTNSAKDHFRFTRLFTPTLLAATLFVSTIASAVDPTEVQLDKLSPQQLEQAADAGDPDAQYALGYLYYYGNGVPQDTQKAMDWIKRASVQGQEQAIKALAMMQSTQTKPAQPAPAKAPTAVAKAAPVTQPTPAPSTAPAPISDVKPVNTAAVQSATVPSSPPSTTNTVAPATTGQPNAQTAAVATSADYLSREEQHLLGLPGNFYTVQVLGSYNEADVKSYIEQYDLNGKVAYYKGDHNGKDWFVVLYGLYDSPSAAKAVIPTLPEGMQKQKPWVKPLSAVQEGIKNKRA
jgi:DamX protein